jgi:hypothetical protein
MSDQTDGVAADLKKVEHRLESVERAVATLSQSMGEQFAQVGAALVEQREDTELGHERLDAKMDAGFAQLETRMDAGFGRVERKLNQFIDVQLTTNDLVDRRLRALESGQRRPMSRERR